MNSSDDIYRAEILRAVLGDKANAAKVHNPTRLNQIVRHLAQSEEAQAALRAKGYGRAGMTFIEIVREVPNYSASILKRIFRTAPAPTLYSARQDVHDIWSPR